MNKLANARVRLAYQRYLLEARGQSPKSIDAALAAINLFEQFSKGREFNRVHPDLVMAFKRFLLERVSEATRKPYGVSMVVHVLGHCRAFFRWLAEQKCFRKIDRTVIEYFHATRRELALVRNTTPKRTPKVGEVVEMILSMPHDTREQRRDRAMVAFLLLTGLRASALASLQLKHVDLKRNAIFQDAKEVRTKFSKSILTFLLPIDPVVLDMAIGWVNELKDLGLPDNAPLFPPAAILGALETDVISSEGLRCWSNSTPVRRIIKAAFETAGLEYCTPHQFRKAISLHFMQLGLTVEQLWCLGINLGHTNPATTLVHYCRPADERREEVIRMLGVNQDSGTPGRLVLGFLSWCEKNRPDAAEEIAAILARPR